MAESVYFNLYCELKKALISKARASQLLNKEVLCFRSLVSLGLCLSFGENFAGLDSAILHQVLTRVLD